MGNKRDIKADVRHLLDNVGGVENVVSVYHCVTRMRFHLKDRTKANDEVIKKQGYAKGINYDKNTNEYQVIIGITVEKFFETFCEVNHYSEEGLYKGKQLKSEEIEIEAIKSKYRKGKYAQKTMQFLSQAFAPLVNPMIAYGLLLTVWSLLGTNWNPNNPTSSAKDSVAFFNGLYEFFGILTGSFTLFITICLGYTVFKAKRSSVIYGLILGIILTAPALMSMGDAANNKDVNNIIEAFPKFGDWVKYPWKINFNGLLIPVIVVYLFGVYLEKITNKIQNDTARTLLQPLIIIGGGYAFGMLIMAPIGLLLTYYLGQAIKWMTVSPIAKYFFVPVLGASYGWIVITGLHHCWTPIILQSQATDGASMLQGLCTLSNVSQGIASIAFAISYKKIKEIKDASLSNGASAIVGGITEPSLYTINLKYIYPLIGASIGVFLGSIILVASNSFALQGASSIFGLLMFQHQSPKDLPSTWAGGGYAWGSIALLISCCGTFLSTWLLSKTKVFKSRTTKMLKEEYNFVSN